MRFLVIPAALLCCSAAEGQAISNLAAMPIFFSCLAQDDQLYARYNEKAEAEARKAVADLPKLSDAEVRELLRARFRREATDQEFREFKAEIDPVLVAESFRDQQGRMKAMVRDSAWAACVQRKQWVSKPLCADVGNALLGDKRPDMRPILTAHQDEYQRLKPMVDYFEAAFPRGGEPRSNAPRCPE